MQKVYPKRFCQGKIKGSEAIQKRNDTAIAFGNGFFSLRAGRATAKSHEPLYRSWKARRTMSWVGKNNPRADKLNTANHIPPTVLIASVCTREFEKTDMAARFGVARQLMLIHPASRILVM